MLRSQERSEGEEEMLIKRRKTQSMVEIVVISIAIIVALLIMGGYVRKGMSGKFKAAADGTLDGQFDPKKGSYIKAINESGQSVSVIGSKNFTFINQDTGKAVEGEFHYSLQSGGEKSGGAPLTSTEVTHTDLEWQNLTFN